MRHDRLSRAQVITRVALATVAVGLAATTAGAAAWAGSTDSNRGGGFESTLIGRPADAAQNVAIRGVPAGGVPWTVDVGRTQVTGGGQLSVNIKGLLIVGTGTGADGTTGPVHHVVATLTCEGTTVSSVSTDAVPLSATGDANIEARVDVPATCLAPILLVRANSAAGPWIAATGL